MTLHEPVPPPEFSRPLRVEDLPPGESERRLAATDEERAALARRFDLVSLEMLEATLSLMPIAGGRVRVRGELSARLTQSCVVTLAPVTAEVATSFELLFAPPAPERDEPMEEEIGANELPEPITDGVIDLGEAVAGQFGLEIDLFPRAPGAVFTGYSTGEAAEAKPANPFAVLAELKKKG
ncbi:MAG: DUF177 domain-containing protein [Magnetospirillum sp. WYHS-4]